MLAKQINKLQEDSQLRGFPDDALFQNWLLWDESFKDQEPEEVPR